MDFSIRLVCFLVRCLFREEDLQRRIKRSYSPVRIGQGRTSSSRKVLANMLRVGTVASRTEDKAQREIKKVLLEVRILWELLPPWKIPCWIYCLRYLTVKSLLLFLFLVPLMLNKALGISLARCRNGAAKDWGREDSSTNGKKIDELWRNKERKLVLMRNIVDSILNIIPHGCHINVWVWPLPLWAALGAAGNISWPHSCRVSINTTLRCDILGSSVSIMCGYISIVIIQVLTSAIFERLLQSSWNVVPTWVPAKSFER